MATSLKGRLSFIDAMKLLGMTAIFIGHIPEAGHIADYVFYYHVPFFFFLSGCFSMNHTNQKFGKFLKEKIKSILIPYFFFLIISIAVQTFIGPLSISQILNGLKEGLLGMRYHVWPFQLWFLPCLFMVMIILNW